MKVVHVITVGTSIRGNFSKMNPKSTSPSVEDYLDFVTYQPEKASAELAAFIPKAAEVGADALYLVGTDTEEGRLCTEVLRRFFKGKNVEVGTAFVHLGTAQDVQERFFEGLQSLTKKVVNYVTRRIASGDKVYINATGGFKPETAFLVLVANALGCEVYYRHETFQQPVTLPLLLPVKFGVDILEILWELKDHKGILPPSIVKRLPAHALEEAERRGLVKVERNEAQQPYRVKILFGGKLALAIYPRELVQSNHQS